MTKFQTYLKYTLNKNIFSMLKFIKIIKIIIIINFYDE